MKALKFNYIKNTFVIEVITMILNTYNITLLLQLSIKVISNARFIFNLGHCKTKYTKTDGTNI